ncbi:MAG: S41 family peptidase [Candidatus Levybacteria bacterium]|nr:S41 family peptidase [Candidatus Levybacteria bacterium]
MRTIRFIAVIIIAGILGYYLGVNKVALDWNAFHPSIQISSKEPPTSVSTLDFSKFWTVFEKVQADYYDKSAIDQQKLLDGAISGMVSSLDDPFTTYLPPVRNSDFKQAMAGQFTGIGAELGMKEKQIIVIAPIDGSPAQKAGIRAGDAILKVDSLSTAGLTLSQAVEKIRGPKETKVALTILRAKDSSPKVLNITRDVITVKSVTSWLKPIKEVEEIKLNDTLKKSGDSKISYIRLSQFGDNTNQEWLTFSNELALKMQTDKSIKGVILDLRNNPGGYVTDAVFIASEFLKMGQTVVIQDFGSGREERLNVTRNGLLLDTPLIILINKGSASASEIVTGAMRDYDRAVIVGEQSFGKGTMQSAEDLGSGAGLHVTIARWLTPNKIWVGNGKNGEGIKPDVTVSLDEKDPSRDTQLEKAIEEILKK